MRNLVHSSDGSGAMYIRGARCAIGPQDSVQASLELSGGRLTHVLRDGNPFSISTSGRTEIDLSGFLLMPGLINAHDHLQFALFPRLANPPYRNYIDWGEDIHARFPDVIAKHKSVPKDVRLWWGVIRNLLCGVTTVCHHDALWPELRRQDLPVRVVQRYGWAHSLALGGDLRQARSATPEGSPFIVHACEGIDDLAKEELVELDRLGVLDASTVLVHGLAIDDAGVALMRQRQASLIVCPSSNHFLFGRLPDMDLLGAIENVSLGSDSPLTATGDLLDEIRFVTEACNIASNMAYRMVTEAPATLLRLTDGEGTIRVCGPSDLIAVRDTGQGAADRLRTLSMAEIEFVMMRGRVQLASETVWKRLPTQAREGLESLWIDGNIRWLRAPVRELLRKAEEVLGPGEVRLGGRLIDIPAFAR